MTTLSAQPAPAPSRALQGILCIEIGMLFFVGQDALMKSLLTLYPVWLLIFVRSIVTLLVLTPLIWWLGAPHRLLTPLWPLHLLRAFLFASGFSMFYAAFPFMGLAEVSTIFFAAPLITALMAALFLGETIGPHRSIALVVGFGGVLIAMNPAGENFSWAAVLPLLCAVTYAMSQIIARRIGDRESTLTVGLYTLTFAGVLILPMGWFVNQVIPITPDLAHLRWELPARAFSDLPRLTLLGLIGMAGYMLLSRAYQVANASLVAPFDYSYLPFATIVAWLLWDEVPGLDTLAGMALIIASGLYLGWRELRAARRTDEMPVTAEAIFVPGSPLPPQIPEEESAQ
ncbi:Permease of the drug/metabolite transporter (DMT) superfamily [Roseovarius azorensis]|uniref:Permease of the drug/metabolite transporter (DMT) superfamily n=1 Tax=Roseovarius azorensis TaxID=1287727 RepID=A0A1H7WIU1_9RHOB|nr:DMT family transporter [Roseovarius azorensis]SEM21410.1 Permease of the drug/metabolite transporter (DMT) superfamily [Roseovarius azorensis]